MTGDDISKGEFGVTIYGNASKAVRILAGVTLQCVMLHTFPDPTDSPAVQTVRSAYPGAALDFGIPGNTFADDGPADLRQKAKTAVRSATAFNARFIQLNCEAAEKKGYPGWKFGNSNERFLRDQAVRLMEAFQEEIALQNSPVRLSFTSHDWPITHRLPWPEFLGPKSLVEENSPQVYPGLKRPGASFESVKNRLIKTRKQWLSLPGIRDDMRPSVRTDGVDRASWDTSKLSIYHQAWGMRPQSMVFLGTRTRRSRMWSFPDDLWQMEGLLAAFVLGYLRSSYPLAFDPVMVFQQERALAADGVFGRQCVHALWEENPVFRTLVDKVTGIPGTNGLIAVQGLWS